MKAMILCAGYGTRLGDLTKAIPKPMLPIAGKPLLEYIINNLRKYGFNKLVINLHYKPDMIKEYFKDGSNWNVEITYSYEEKILGTGGAIKNIESFFSQDDLFVVHYGDILTNQNYSEMIKYHKQKGAWATLLLHTRKGSNSVVTLDDHKRITLFCERPGKMVQSVNTGSWVNSGVYILKPQVFGYIPLGQVFDLPRDLFSQVFSAEKLYGYPLDGYRCAIDSPERYQMAQKDVLCGNYYQELL